MEPEASKTIHGNKSEERLAIFIGGRQTLASGALDFDKGDIHKDAEILDDGEPVQYSFLIESKATVNASLGLKKEWLDKIRSEAQTRGKTPLVTISFVDKAGEPRDFNSDWVAMPLQLFQELTDIKGGGE